MSTATAFVLGLIVMGYLVAGVFFLRFWRRTRDPLFAVFAAAFVLFAANQTLVALSGLDGEDRGWIYLIRLAAFTLIIVAVLWKNVGARRS